MLCILQCLQGIVCCFQEQGEANQCYYFPFFFPRLSIEQGFLLLRGDAVKLPQCEAAFHFISWSLCWWGLNDWSVYRAVCWHHSTGEESDVMCCAVGTCGVHCAGLAPQYSWVRFQCSVNASCFQSHNSTGGQINFFPPVLSRSCWSPESLVWHGERNRVRVEKTFSSYPSFAVCIEPFV